MYKSRRIRQWAVIAAVWSAATQMQCGGPTSTAGGTSSETTNGVTAAIVHDDGTRAAYATVRLRKSDFVTLLPSMSKSAAIISADALTDSSGRFEITGIEPGSYRIEVTDGRSSSVLLACTLAVGDTADLGTDTLLPYATVIGAIDTTSSTPLSGPRAYVQVAGLERLVAVRNDGSYSIADLPAGALTVRAVDAVNGSVIDTSAVTALAGDTAVAPSPLPAPWQAASIGNERPRGGAAFVNSRFVVAGGGPDIWGTADGFHFVYQRLSGDGSITAHVASFEYSREYFSKAGVMFRESLDPRSANIAVSLENEGQAGRYSGRMHYRKAIGDTSVWHPPVRDSIAAPAWVRLSRTGPLFAGLVSMDGTTWDTIGIDSIGMQADVLVGLAVSSHDTTALSTAAFDSIRIQ
jgi:regulation of enolase protein 1 (concanavalin A-like superfamily)